MKSITLFTTSLALIAANVPTTAQARNGEKTLAVVGGLIGGMIIGSQLNDHHSNTTVVYENTCPPPAPRGYWKMQQVKVWIPARTICTTDTWGRRVEYVQPGYYTFRTERVWVSLETTCDDVRLPEWNLDRRHSRRH